MSAVTRLTQSIQSILFARARHIYAAVVRLVLTYRCEVQYNADNKRIGRNKLIYPLQTIQNKYLRVITRAYKTANVQLLEHKASIQPLDLYLERLVVIYALRIANTNRDRTIVQACTTVEERARQLLRVRMSRPRTKAKQQRNKIGERLGKLKPCIKAIADNKQVRRQQTY